MIPIRGRKQDNNLTVSIDEELQGVVKLNDPH